jgi:hypothetical protein
MPFGDGSLGRELTSGAVANFDIGDRAIELKQHVSTETPSGHRASS